MPKKRVDKRRRIEPPKSFEVERLISFRQRVELVRDPVTGCKTMEKIVPEYLVRWKGYNDSHDLWVKKEDITKDCVDEFNGTTITSAAEMLATVPVALHISSPGYAMAKSMSAMMKQKIILKDGVHAPKRSKISATKSVASAVPLSTSISTKTAVSKDKSPVSQDQCFEKANSKENKTNTDRRKKVSSNESVVATGDKFNMDMINYFDTFVKQLDNIISTANSKQEETKEIAIRKATILYQACLSPQQQKIRSLDYLIAQGTHNLRDGEHVIALRLTDNIQSGWYCNICEKGYGTPRKDTIVKHMLSSVHWLNVTSKYMTQQEHSVSNIIAKIHHYNQYKKVSKMVL